MAIPLRPQENVFFPVPYVENEPNPILITNERVVQFTDAGQVDMPARSVSFVGRTTERPFMVLGVVAAIVGLPLFVIGVYLFISVIGAALPALPAIGKPAEAPAAAAGDDPAAGNPDDPAAAAATPSGPSDPTSTRILGVGLAFSGALALGLGALLVTRRRHFVVLRGGNAMMRLPAKNATDQMMMLSTIQAVQSAGKAATPAAAPAPAVAAAPKVAEVDDGGDPVKALQELAAARAAGKLKDDEFQARRDVLLSRVAKGS